MIYYSVPYSTEKNLGKYYNDFMRVLPNDDDFACFVDGDTIFSTPNYGHIIQSVVDENPEVKIFTCYTNRIGCKWQVAPGIDTDSNDMKYHRDFGNMMQTIYQTTCEDKTNSELLSGVLILLRKDLWKKCGGFTEGGMLGIDNDIHKKAKKLNEKIYLMKGVYLFHWYRWPNPKDKTHLL
jgi:hypothetical protein